MKTTPDRSVSDTAAVPWYIWCSVIAVTCAALGFHWDISWHRSIGRDTFWSPPHIAIYLCGVLAGISSGYLILSTTFGETEVARGASVKIWGVRGPLGAFICTWGGVAMLTSAPFDNWWHSAYGLDVKVYSPPHAVLIMGMLAIGFGVLVLLQSHLSRAQSQTREHLNVLLLYVGAMGVILLLMLTMEYILRHYMHSSIVYRVVSTTVPIILAGLSRASGRRWASTTIITIYTVCLLGLVWILPLFPAEPKLGPVYHQVTHFIPPEFPLLLIVPAVALDLLWAKTAGWNSWWQAVIAGSAFLVAFITMQWPFADFLMSPGARNRFFGAYYHSYFQKPESYYVRNLFFPWDPTPAQFWSGMALALTIAILTTRAGLAWGEWMRRLRR